MAACRWPFAATPGELLQATGVGVDDWWGGAAAAAAAALAFAAAVWWSARARANGGFAVVAGGVAAAGPPLVAMAWPLAVAPTAAIAGGSAVLAFVLLPWLRDRGLLALALVAAAVVAPPAVAFGRARAAGQAAQPLRVLAAALTAMPADLDAVALVLAADVDADTAAAIPLVAGGRTVFAVAYEAPEAQWLLRMGMPVLRLQAGACGPVSAGRGPWLGPGSLPIAASYVRAADGGPPTGIAVHCARARKGDIAVLFTPCGSVAGAFGGDGNAEFDAGSTARLRRWLAPLPTAPRIRVLVVPPAAADGYGWTDLRP